MPTTNRLRLSSLAAVAAALAIAAGAGLSGCGDNKPKAPPVPDSGTEVGGEVGGDTGGPDVTTICSGSFITPADTAKLTVADAIGGTCTGGTVFKIDVRIATSQPDGTSVDLLIGTAKVATATVQGAEVRFPGVTIPQGAQTLKASFSATCQLTAMVTVDCNLPTCDITKPKIDGTHVALNGVPVANGGDRVSAAGSPYQVEFDVATNVEDGQPVTLNITNPVLGGGMTVVTGAAVGGTVKFPGVTLVPDGNYTIAARCTNKAGAVGQSTQGTYPVDSTAPNLTISSPTNGKYFGPTDLTQTTPKTFAVCAQTTDKDATSDTVKTLSVAVGTGSPDPNTGYVSVAAINTDACVNIACTSSMPFNLTATLRDSAGNSTVKTVNNITCATDLPSIEIVSPVADSAPFSDPLKHLLASGSTNTFKDQNAGSPGAQWTVAACTDTAGMVTLFGGAAGGNLTVLAGPVATVAAVAGDNCRSGFSQVAKFPGVTLPESQEDVDGALSVATELRADIVTATTATNQSNVVDVWVDSSTPNIAQSIPPDLCGKVYQSTMDVTGASVRLLSTTPTVSMVVTGTGGPATYTPVWLNGFATFNGVTFTLGQNQVTATGTERSGNSSALVSPCTVTVGTPPVVTFVTPLATSTLCAAGQTNGTCIPDADVAAGWQGDLDAIVTVTGVATPTGTVTFSLGTTDLGTVAIDGTGHARLSNVTIPDGKAVVLTAATNDIATHGIGMASETLVADTVIPDRVATVTAAVKDRRQTSFHLSWTAPADGGQPLYSYIVKVSKSPITLANFDAGTTVTYTGSPAAPTLTDGIDATGLLIETNYYFAVAPVDAAGNRGTIATTGPASAHFNMNVLVPPAGGPTNERFGEAVDGVADLNGDGKSDILVGTLSGQRVYIYNGSATFGTVTAPTTMITGQASVGFGRQFIDVGDIDADGRDDYAISAPLLGNGKIYIFKGRASWNTAYNADSDADYILDLGTSYAATGLGASMSRLGDFNGDGVDDFAVSANGFNGSRGRIVVILGRSGFSAATLNTMTIDGDPTYPAGIFGTAVLGMGRFYAATSGTTLVVTAPSAGLNTRGRVYAFHGIPGTTASLVATAADNFVEGPVDLGAYGTSIGLVGSLAGVPGLMISTGRATSLGNGVVDVHSGSTATGPFSANPLRFTDSLATGAGEIFGRVIAGSAFAGTSITVSVIGDGKPDIIMAPITESGGGPTRLYIVDGARLFAISNPANVVTTADVILPLPSDWKTLPLQRNAMIRDLDGDGFGDFAIGENISTGAGRLAVFW